MEYLLLPLAALPFPDIDPILIRVGPLAVHWYGLGYVVGILFSWWYTKRLLANDGLWRGNASPAKPVVMDDFVLWAALGVVAGGRIGYVLFYDLQRFASDPLAAFAIWEGGMSFHGGLLGVIVAYWIYCAKTGKPRGEFFDGLSLATAPGVAVVRFGNFINAELWGRTWDGPWAMRFPRYNDFLAYLPPSARETFAADSSGWMKAREAGVSEDILFEPARHPSQLYEMFAEGIILYFVLRFLMLRLGWGGGRIAASFLIGYGAMRFVVENFREPDTGIGFQLGTWLTRGQLLCVGMMLAGLIVWLLCKPFPPKSPDDEADTSTPAA